MMEHRRPPFGGHGPWQSTRREEQGHAWNISLEWPVAKNVSKVQMIGGRRREKSFDLR